MEVVASLSQGRTAAAQCGLFKHKSVPVIFEPPCTNTLKTQQIYYNLPLPGYIFRLLRVIIKPSNELTQDCLIPSALWNPVALTTVGAIVLWVHVCYYSVYGYLCYYVTI